MNQEYPFSPYILLLFLFLFCSIMQPESLAELPDEMFSFSLLGFTPTLLAPRLGRLALTGRKPIQTPNHVPITSRGVLPHVSHDIMNDRMSIGSLYAAFEDCKMDSCRFNFQRPRIAVEI